MNFTVRLTFHGDLGLFLKRGRGHEIVERDLAERTSIKVVRHGYYPRSQDAAEQTIEVMRRFDLSSVIAPFTRCLRCNALLEKVEKGEVIEKLEPLTRIHYEQFRRCAGCGQIYWPGSHFDKLRARIEGIRAILAVESRSENQI